MAPLPNNQKPVFHLGGSIQNQQNRTNIPSNFDTSEYRLNATSAQSGAIFTALQASNNRQISSPFVLASIKQNISETSTCLDSSTGTRHPDNPCIVCVNGLWKNMSQVDPCYAYFPAQGGCQSIPIHNQCYDCEPTNKRINPSTGFEEHLDNPIAKFTFKCKACEKCSDGTCIDNCPNGWECTAKFNDSDGTVSYECAFKCSNNNQCDRNDCEVCLDGVCKYSCYSGQRCENGQCIDICDPACVEDDCQFCRFNPETNQVECSDYCEPGQICCKGECYDNNCTCGATFDTNTCKCGPDQCPPGFTCLGDSNDPNSTCVELDVEGCTYYDANGIRQQGCDPSIPCNECYTLYSSEYSPPLMFSICRQCPADTLCYNNECVPNNQLDCEIPCHFLMFDESKCSKTSINASDSNCYSCQDICAKLGPRLTCYNGICQEVYDIRPLLANILP